MKKPKLQKFLAHMAAAGYEGQYSLLQWNLLCEGQYSIAVSKKSLRAWLNAGGELPPRVEKQIKRFSKSNA